MSRNVLKDEREAARRAIKGLGLLARAWDWETCGDAEPCPPMDKCLKAVSESYAIVVILGRDLTGNTRAEHELAVQLGIPDFIFVKDVQLKPETKKHLVRHGSRCSYKLFKNPFELETYVQRSVRDHIVANCLAHRIPALGTFAQMAQPTMGTPARTIRSDGGKLTDD